MNNKKTLDVKIRDIVDTLGPNQKKVYTHLPELLLEEKTFDEVAKEVDLKYSEVVDIYDKFLKDIWTTTNTDTITAVLSRLENQSQTRLLVESFKATKKFGRMWTSCVDDLSKIETLITGKIDKLIELQKEGEEVSDKELSRVIDMAGKHQKHVVTLMDSSPLARSSTKGGGFNVVLNNNLSSKEEPKKTNEDVVIETEGYVEPPDI